MFSATRPPEGLMEWDAWYQEHDGLMHGFALIAPDSLHPDARHDHARIGHFVSRNLVDWKQLPNVLTPQEGVLAHWTGSNIVEEEQHAAVKPESAEPLTHMFFTYRLLEKSDEQHIGHAVSRDLTNWEEVTQKGNLPKPSGPYNDTAESYFVDGVRCFPAWRDPFEFKDHEGYKMLISARTAGNVRYNGCIALAASQDLYNWEMREPYFAEGHFDEMECAQRITAVFDEPEKEYEYLLFQTRADHYAPEWKEEVGQARSGLHGFYRINNGPWLPVNGTAVIDGHGEEIYDIRMVRKYPDRHIYQAIGWIGNVPGSDVEFAGAKSMPFDVIFQKDKVFALVR